MNAIPNPKAFFDEVRGLLFAGTMSQAQVDGTNSILGAWTEQAPYADPRFVAYALATAFWETARTMQPIAEYGHGAGRPYGVAIGQFGKVYYGRGFVQLTWEANYQRAGKELGVGLDADPELALQPDIAAKIMIRGMLEGWFTGRKLADFFVGTRSDWLDARTIINGHDHAGNVAGYALHFYQAIMNAS